ncbi:hypothetical protein ACROYT_G040379 [Oculina patagonica]
MQNRVVVQPWCQLTNLNVTHNKLAVFDTSLKLLPVLQNLDMSYNEFVHLDLQQLCCPSLKCLNLSHNNIHFITGMPGELAHLKSLILSHNNLETVSGLDCLTGLIELDLSHNQIRVVHEISKLCLSSHLKYLSVSGNPFARVKPYRIVVLSYFKGKEIILDKKPITPKERNKLRSYPTKLRASSSPDYTLGDSNMSEDLLPSRSHSFNLFGPPESDDDSGIEGASSIQSYSMVIDPDEGEIADKELPFNWSYYSGEDEMLSGNIRRLSFDANEQDQMEVGAISDFCIDGGAGKTVDESTRECPQADLESTETVVDDESTLMGTKEAEEQYVPFYSHDPNISAEFSGYKEWLLANSPSINESTETAAEDESAWMHDTNKSKSVEDETEVKTDACEHTGPSSLNNEQKYLLVPNKSVGYSEQIDCESIDSPEQFFIEGVQAPPIDGDNSGSDD